MKKISLEECKKILIEMLKYVVELCEKNEIEYTLIAGTLIGAIRHKGFIPWDDDIDIIMSRDNYNKFIKITEKNKHKYYKFFTWENNKTYNYPFGKVIDTRTIVKEKQTKEITGYGIYIDIFAYDKLPNKNLKFYYYKRVFWRHLLDSHISEYHQKGTKYAFIKNLRKKVINTFTSRTFILKKYEQVYQKYNNSQDNLKNVMINWNNYGLKKETLKKEWFSSYKETKFEGIDTKITTNYNEILSYTYGDYMKLPPVEKRISHGYSAYWKEKRG